MERAPFCGNHEPTLDQLFADPIIHCLMQRDGTEEKEVRALIASVSRAAPRAAPPKLQFSDPKPLLQNGRERKAPSFPAMAQSLSQQQPWPRVFPGL